MKKIPSLFKRDYEGTHLVYNEVVEGSEWVISGEGNPTVKWDGSSCLVRKGHLYRRYDRKVTKQARRRGSPYTLKDCKPAPPLWEPCEDSPNTNTGHWPGWVPVMVNPEATPYLEAWLHLYDQRTTATYELVGPKMQSNPYRMEVHRLIQHGHGKRALMDGVPRTFDALRAWFEINVIEGLVWHHPDGRMVKIKRRDFGFQWPPA